MAASRQACTHLAAASGEGNFRQPGTLFFLHVTQGLGNFKYFVYPFASFLFPVSWCSQDVAASSDQGCSFEFKEDSSLLVYYSNNYHCLTKTNKQSIRGSEGFQYKHICQNLVILNLGGPLIGSMDFRWTGSVGFERSVIPGGQGVFWQADLREARMDRQERGPGVGGMLIMERGEHVWQRERMENTCPISHLFTFDCQTPARLKEEEAGGRGNGKGGTL